MNADRFSAMPPCSAWLAATIATLMSACSLSTGQPAASSSPDGTPVPEVVVVEARAAGAGSELRLPGRTSAGELARLYARASGFIAERKVDLGDHVEAGQVLAVISAPEIDQAVREAEAGVAQARADEQLARVNAERASALIRSGAVSKETENERSASHAVAKASRVAAEARLASARERQRYTMLRAPFAGIISARNVERGDRVVADQSTATPLFELIAPDPLRVIVDVPQRVALQVHKGLKATVSFRELHDEPLQAEVVRSAQSINEQGGGMRIELQLPNPEAKLPVGMLGEVQLSIPRDVAAVLVPVGAVIRDAAGTRVAIVDHDSALSYRDVETGNNLGNEIEIARGLDAGDLVIASPNALLKAGDKVNVRRRDAGKS